MCDTKDSTSETKKAIIEIIENRILSEYTKHKELDWHKIASRKIYVEIMENLNSTSKTIDYIKCDKCGCKTSFSLAIDNWCIIENENYCRKCQKKHKVGWYKAMN